MAINKQLESRSNQSCELCAKDGVELFAYAVPPKNDENPDNQVVLCSECLGQVQSDDYSNTHYWRCLEGSIWSEVPAVKVLSYKILGKLSSEEWAADSMESAGLDEELLAWAGAEDRLEAEKVIHKDSYGTVLETGDNVVLTQNLNVKGTSYIAPKGTMVRKIKLVADNAEQIEGKINGDTIVILTKFVKKSV
ncbi:PhnA domain-containing protein [Pararcticibacter amylolyticus]|uniref:PhnA protein n=1 Tax=Pararcticibacter amylolyticus TaxID=2173175 RepID=A0A2U2PL30_9SPHI|nr:alkylphosphonate utilization protein [Pararcticibacter amylolyticus]PWG81984.1 PhnA protein [Pararcticibacter amylolyticus]